MAEWNRAPDLAEMNFFPLHLILAFSQLSVLSSLYFLIIFLIVYFRGMKESVCIELLNAQTRTAMSEFPVAH